MVVIIIIKDCIIAAGMHVFTNFCDRDFFLYVYIRYQLLNNYYYAINNAQATMPYVSSCRLNAEEVGHAR